MVPYTPPRAEQFNKRKREYERRTMTLMQQLLTREQRQLLRSNKKCFKCFGDFALCGGVTKCTHAPRSAATKAILDAIDKLGGNPQLTMLRLLNTMDDQTTPEEEDEGDSMDAILDSAETAVLNHIEELRGEDAASQARDLFKMEMSHEPTA